MFVRFRQTARRLQASLVATHRIDGRVQHEHVASLGSVPRSPSPADRIAFWTKLHQRLATLGNRIDDATHGAVLTAVHARIPMPTQDDHQTVQLDRAKANARVWAMLSDVQADQITGLKGVAAKAAAAAASAEPAAAAAAEKAAAAVEQVARAERGEDVGPIPPPTTRAALLRMLGWTEAQAAHAVRLADIGDDHMEEVLAEITRRQKQSERAASRAVLRRLRGSGAMR